jgi:hypothetical protein
LYLVHERNAIILIVSRKVYEAIANSSEGRNVTEWCKKEACWLAIQKIDV